MKYTIFSLLLLSSLSLIATAQEQNENEHPNVSNLSNSLLKFSLDKTPRDMTGSLRFVDIKKRVQQCLNMGSIQELNNVFTSLFNNDAQDENFFTRECTENGITKWPSQTTFREAWLGEIFYPEKEINLYYEHFSNEYLLKRFDILCSLAMSARHNNPMALYYLVRGMQIHINTIADCETEVIPNLYKKALNDLEKVEKNDAVYLLRGRAYELGYQGGYDFNEQHAFKLHAESKAQESQLQMLLIREKYVDFVKPTREEYTNLSKIYPKAYIKIAEKFAQNFEEKVHLLNLAYENGYYPALLELGWLYGRAGYAKEALQYHHAYSEDHKLATGYYYSSMLYVPRVDYRKYYQNKSEEEIHSAIHELQKACDFPHQEASYRLGLLFLEQYRRNNDLQWQKRAIEYFQKAALLGEMDAYTYIDQSKDNFGHLNDRINEILCFIGYYSK